jgi:hypothetical protein
MTDLTYVEYGLMCRNPAWTKLVATGRDPAQLLADHHKRCGYQPLWPDPPEPVHEHWLARRVVHRSEWARVELSEWEQVTQ